ncbi:hypothetical protein NHH88_17290 [Oxalobacteraceae bacterium OTU3CAMAD1]|nr:hypothetical protein NHH88_17290 [Oxalobacteraceae bacterium OTU3CAMAD1]
MAPESINSKMRGYGNDIQAILMVECINWTINRWKTHDLDPKIRFQLYALITVAKYTYDQTVWPKWFGAEKAPQFSGRQQIIFSEALRAMKEFEEDLERTGKSKNDYKVPQIPFKY